MKLWRILGISVVVALALLLVVVGSALALVEQLTLDELAAKADSILVGEVTGITCYQEGEGNIYTLVTLSVEQAIKGATQGDVVVKLSGGEVDGLGLWVEDVPSFQLGERAVVFLEDMEDAFGLCGWYQGKFTVENDWVLERDQSLTNFMADIGRAMGMEGTAQEGEIEAIITVEEEALPKVEGAITFSLSVEEFPIGTESSSSVIYDRQAAYNYAQKYWDKICSDGCFWDESSSPTCGLTPEAPLGSRKQSGYDCAHFVSCCIGNAPNEKGGGLNIDTRVPPAYGEPGAQRLKDWLLNNNVAEEVSSIGQLENGDVVFYDLWGSDWLDHSASYLGSGRIATHSWSYWNVNWDIYDGYYDKFNPNFIHIKEAACDFRWYGDGVWSEKAEYTPNEDFIDYSQFGNYGDTSDYTVYFYLYNPSGVLRWTASGTGTLTEGYSVKWTVTIHPAAGGGSEWEAGDWELCSEVKPPLCSDLAEKCCINKVVPPLNPPHIDSISPSSGPAGTGFQATITGTNFGATQGTSTVIFWRRGSTYVEAPAVSWSDTQIVCEVPSGASSGDTSHGVRVTTSVGTSNDYPFTVSFSYSGHKWFGTNPMGEKYWINPNTADCTGEWRAVIEAMQTWNNVDNANFYFEYGGLTSATNYSYNGYNEIMWVNYDTGSIATCITWYNAATGEISESDIVFNDLDFTWDTNGSPPPCHMDVQNIATHELGHSLCLLDLYGTADSEKTMYGYGACQETKKRTLEAEDIAGIRWIYPGLGTRGQYHIKVTNNDDDNLEVYFKSDIDAEYYRHFNVPSGQTLTSWWEVLPTGSHQVSIKWTDPDKGTEDFMNSAWLNVPVEGDTEFPFTIPLYTGTIAPTVTTNAATNVEETTATLNGMVSNDGGEPCQYRFEYDTNSGEPYAYNTGWTGSKTSGQSFSAAISGLSKGTKYYFRAQAKNSGGTASGSELTFLTKPDAPTSFGASTASTTQINLSWTKGDGAQKTKIQRKEGSYPANRNDGTQVYFGTGTGTPDTGLTPGTTYYYRAWSYVQGSEQWSDNYAQDWATTAGAEPDIPDITVSPPSFDLTLAPDKTHDYTLTIGNTGDATLTYDISDVETTGMTATAGSEKLLSQPGNMVLEAPLKGSPVKPEDTPEGGNGWQSIMTDGFEGAFPGTKWQLFSNPTWGKESYQRHTGLYSVWCAGSSYNPPSNYPNNMEAWIVYGPFSLTDATDAELGFWFWNKSQGPDDYLFWGASIDGSWFYGSRHDGDSAGWQSVSFDLTDVYTLGNLCGQTQVWIGFFFGSDESVTDKGAFIDDVVLRKYVGGAAEDCPWLDEDPKCGMVAPGDPADSITVSINTTGLCEGNYSANIVIDNNDPDESPTIVPVALHVSPGANNPPNTPSNPSPANHATVVSINADLSWTGGDPDAGDTVTYDVYFGTSASPPLVSNDQTATTYDPGALNYNTKYYWKIVATDNHAASATGPVWYFTTGSDGLGTTVAIDPAAKTVNQGEQFTLDILVTPGQAIAGGQCNIGFDASLITVDSVAEGDLFSQGGAGTFFMCGNIDNTAGTITGMAGVITTPGLTVSDEGVFATITFTASASTGDTPIALSGVIVGDAGGDAVAVEVTNGSVTVSLDGGLIGDVNGDGHVNVQDLVRVGQHFGQTGTPGWIPEDVKVDGVINVQDMVVIGQHWTG